MITQNGITITTDTSGLGGGGGGSEPSIIGASGSYIPPGPPGMSPFVQGDSENLLYNKSPQAISSIQSTLAEAGLLRGDYRNGQVNPATIKAYEEVLRISNSEARAPSIVLRDMSVSNFGAKIGAVGRNIANQAASGGGPSRAPFTARVSNPNDLKRYFREAVINATGEFKGQVDIDKMVEAYQATERNAQAAAYNAAPSGGTVEDGISPDAFVEDALAESVPDEVQTRDVVGRAGQLFGMLGSFGGQ